VADNISDNMVVLVRVDYSETDRIVTALTRDHGKLAFIAKGVRAAKSKLAAGIELFAENKIVIKSSNTDLFILTSARMENYYGEIAKDTEATGYIYQMLKLINKNTPDGQGSEYYPLLINLFAAIKAGQIPLTLIKIWFELKLLQTQGSSPNLTSDNTGAKLSGSANFEFDYEKHCFYAKPTGDFTQKHIKLLRQMAAYKKPTAVLGDLSGVDEQARQLTHVLVEKHFG